MPTLLFTCLLGHVSKKTHLHWSSTTLKRLEKQKSPQPGAKIGEINSKQSPTLCCVLLELFYLAAGQILEFLLIEFLFVFVDRLLLTPGLYFFFFCETKYTGLYLIPLHFLHEL